MVTRQLPLVARSTVLHSGGRKSLFGHLVGRPLQRASSAQSCGFYSTYVIKQKLYFSFQILIQILNSEGKMILLSMIKFHLPSIVNLCVTVDGK